MIDLDEEAFKAYSAQRWLWNEPAQLQRRFVISNLNTLPGIAEEAAGPDAICVSLTKLPEGNSNKAFLATMRASLLVKIPNPNAGPAHYTTASEVATMQYVKERLHIRVPKVLAYCSKASESKLSAEYIVMEKAPGMELSQKWDELKPREKLSIVKQVAAITSTLARSQFPYHGALYKRRDLSTSESIVVDNEFVMGPSTGRAWSDDRRGDVDVPRGPCMLSAEDALRALARREEACVEKFPTFQRDCQQIIFGGPGGYQPTKEAKLSVMQDFFKRYRHIMPKSKELCAGVISHNDLHMDNIFVDTENSSKVTSIIDWQGVPVYPMFLIAHHPSLIEYTGPKLAGFVEPTLPENLNSLDPEAKKGREGFSLLSDFSEDGIWKQVVGVDENGDASERSCQKEEYAKWERDVERKGRVPDEIGLYAGWNGAVSPQDYDEVVRRLAAAKDRFLTRDSTNEQERAFWEEVWPFQDPTLE
ncbi:kinase-like domain-containing protein [Aspergillus keveii]|uniref:Altered inheritance of mitochondria protein 9, mitochondrial n=1 Tax=Aspergillus keveii TaxID=714993 RepID=A0ABR4GIT6_9EURO